MACDARRDRTARRGGRRVDREAMELATWYHDANCEIARDYNEDRSAQLAREMLSSSPIRDEVARLVLVTKTHKVRADLSMLGSRYRAYAAAVRTTTPTCPTKSTPATISSKRSPH